MGSPIHSMLHSGSGGILLDVECYLSNGLPAIVIVGLGNKAVDEAKERIRGAFASSGLQLPRKRITINLAPADIPKDSTSLDLPIAVAILQSANQLPKVFSRSEVVIGELGLDGSVRAIRGIIGKLLAGRENGIDTFFIPRANLEQASLVPEVNLFPVSSVSELFSFMGGRQQIEAVKTGSINFRARTKTTVYPLSHIAGQERAKRAIEIAAAGGHNLFLTGPPGTGKSMLAKALPHLLPPLTPSEMLEVTHLHSLASNTYDKLVTERPFRTPHHSSSHTALIGGGNTLRPGEISLSHRGILFLDEMPEFGRSSLEALRQPLEDNIITIARAKEVATYPANFILVATANPCPCGYYGTSKPCSCPLPLILRYRQKVSGPIMDRFDLYCESEPVEHSKLLRNYDTPTKEDDLARSRIEQARKAQAYRYGSEEKLNSHLENRDLAQSVQLPVDVSSLLNQAAVKLDISARSYMRIIKVARTIADLEASDEITAAHMAEALQYRTQNLNTLN